MNPRILELAKKATVFDCSSLWYVGCEDELEAFYQLAHQDGQKQMRERAAKVAEEIRQVGKSGDDIRNLEITK